MGHFRLGSIPETRKWNALVARFAQEQTGASPGVPQVASQALDAVGVGLHFAAGDPRRVHSFLLLTQLAGSRREPDWDNCLHQLAIKRQEVASEESLVAQLRRARPRALVELRDSEAGLVAAGNWAQHRSPPPLCVEELPGSRPRASRFPRESPAESTRQQTPTTVCPAT